MNKSNVCEFVNWWINNHCMRLIFFLLYWTELRILYSHGAAVRWWCACEKWRGDTQAVSLCSKERSSVKPHDHTQSHGQFLGKFLFKQKTFGILIVAGKDPLASTWRSAEGCSSQQRTPHRHFRSVIPTQGYMKTFKTSSTN